MLVDASEEGIDREEHEKRQDIGTPGEASIKDEEKGCRGDGSEREGDCLAEGTTTSEVEEGQCGNGKKKHDTSVSDRRIAKNESAQVFQVIESRSETEGTSTSGCWTEEGELSWAVFDGFGYDEEVVGLIDFEVEPG
jgi:hypothetical protein